MYRYGDLGALNLQAVIVKDHNLNQLAYRLCNSVSCSGPRVLMLEGPGASRGVRAKLATGYVTFDS